MLTCYIRSCDLLAFHVLRFESWEPPSAKRLPICISSSVMALMPAKLKQDWIFSLGSSMFSWVFVMKQNSFGFDFWPKENSTTWFFVVRLALTESGGNAPSRSQWASTDERFLFQLGSFSDSQGERNPLKIKFYIYIGPPTMCFSILQTIFYASWGCFQPERWLVRNMRPTDREIQQKGSTCTL